MTIPIPRVFPQVLSVMEGLSVGSDSNDVSLVGTSGFLLQFSADPETGSVHFPSLLRVGVERSALQVAQARLVPETSEDCKLSLLAITLDAWRIIHRLVIGSPARRDEIYERLQRRREINHALWSTHGEWMMENYYPDFQHMAVLAHSVFSDGDAVPPLTGNVALRHSSGRTLEVSLAASDLSMKLGIGWEGGDAASVRLRVAADSAGRVTTDEYAFHFSGQALRGLRSILGMEGATMSDVAVEVGAKVYEADQYPESRLPFFVCRKNESGEGLIFSDQNLELETSCSDAGEALRIILRNTFSQDFPLMPLQEGVRELLWGRALQHIVRRTYQ